MPNPSAKLAPPLATDSLLTSTPKETVQRAMALSCSLPKDNKPSCSGAVFLGVFFDGTGNNRDKDLPLHQQSNVVRLWMAHRDSDEDKGSSNSYYRPVYIPGVGTPFPEIGEVESKGWVSGWIARKLATLGSAGALGGEARIYWGLIQTINVMHRYVKKEPLITDKKSGEMCQSASLKTSGMNELKEQVRKLTLVMEHNKPTVTMLTISVFGFSRGAAKARAFCNAFYKLCEADGKNYKFAGVPVRINFLGLFDTVASSGVIGADLIVPTGHQGWADSSLRIPPAVEKCVHYVASHEVRACFPSDTVRYRGQYPSNCTETVYPGSHSDVGGGYPPGSQGRSRLPNDNKQYDFLALIPCIHMYKEAYLAGVPFKEFSRMTPREQRNFTPSAETLAAYNAYIAADTASGSTEEILLHRMNHYRFYRYRKLDTFVDEALRSGSPKKDAEFLKLTNGHFKEQCANFKRKYANAAKLAEHDKNIVDNKKLTDSRAGIKNTTKHVPSMQAHLDKSFIKEDLELWEAMHRVGETPPAVAHLFDKYVHDSMAGFAQDDVDEYALNGRGYMRRRDVFDKGGE
jgi:hypothetical protein